MSEQSIKNQLQEAVKDAMRAKDKDKLSVMRMILAEFKQVEVDKRIELDKTQELAILDKMEKQRKEAQEQFTQANRADLAEKEAYEIQVIQAFKPAALSAKEVEAEIQQAILASGASEAKDMGKVMAILKPKLQGKADIAQVSSHVKMLLAKE